MRGFDIVQLTLAEAPEKMLGPVAGESKRYRPACAEVVVEGAFSIWEGGPVLVPGESLRDGVAQKHEVGIRIRFGLSFEVVEGLPPIAAPTGAASIFGGR